ncbi:MAG TPA: 50S ribosomal protein L22 [Candidatus Krumholzibacteria bacterium]|nr:50S ribosomal protein L22 [Candidatus Krumholzibacteria bacterium]
MEARAVSRHIRLSPRKARLVADLIRGKSVDEALGILALSPQKASHYLRKAVLSAAANVRDRSENEARIQNTGLLVKEVLVNEGPTMKRIRPRSQGRAYRINKRTAHIEVTVSERA